MGTSSPADIHPGTVGIAFLPLKGEAGAIRLNIKVNIIQRSVLVGDRLGGNRVGGLFAEAFQVV